MISVLAGIQARNIGITNAFSFRFLIFNGRFLTTYFRFFLQNSSPTTQDPPVSDTADLLGLNSDPQPPANPATAAPLGFQAGMKAASSNSDLLNDLFAPPAGQTGAVQEDIFFSGATSDSKRMDLASPRQKAEIFLFLCSDFFPLLRPSS